MCCPWVFPFIVAAYDALSVSSCGDISNLSSPGATGVLPVVDEDTLRRPPTKILSEYRYSIDQKTLQPLKRIHTMLC